jgi:hypothetical protein
LGTGLFVKKCKVLVDAGGYFTYNLFM